MNKCFLNSTNDCKGPMSGEHILSRSVLNELSQTKISFSSDRISGEYGLDSAPLKTKSLCQRHNSALSPLDTEAARFVKAFKYINESLHQGVYDKNKKFFIFCGYDIERWLLKTAINFYRCEYSNITKPNFLIPKDIERLISNQNWPPFLGIYLNAPKADLSFNANLSFRMSLVSANNIVCGLNIDLLGLPITLLFLNPYKTNNIEKDFGIYRPNTLVFYKGHDVYTILFVWQNSENQKNILISCGDKDADIPSGIIE